MARRLNWNRCDDSERHYAEVIYGLCYWIHLSGGEHVLTVLFHGTETEIPTASFEAAQDRAEEDAVEKMDIIRNELEEAEMRLGLHQPA